MKMSNKIILLRAQEHLDVYDIIKVGHISASDAKILRDYVSQLALLVKNHPVQYPDRQVNKEKITVASARDIHRIARII